MTLNTISQYGIGFQIKVLSALLTDKKFLQNINDILSEEYFDSQAHKWIINEILRYFHKYHTTPTMEVLKTEVKKIDNDVLQVAVKEQLREAYQSSEDDLEYIEEEFSNFCKNQQLKKALLNSVELLRAGDYDSIRGMIDNALKAGQDKTVGHEYNKDVESRYRENHRVTIPTPWKTINELLQGGLGNGDFGLIFGNPGGGKSWALVALGGAAIKLGYNVIHYTLELGEDYVGRRYDAFFTDISVSKITEHKEDVESTTNKLLGQLVIKEYSPGRASISTLESHIQKCINLGFKPDLIIIDYVDLLSSKRRTIDKKQEIDDIYVSTKGLAKQLSIPVWSVSQVNRAGAKDNIIEGDKAAGSYDKIMITDFALSLSRKKEDKVNGTGRFHVMKNRYGGDGMTYFATVDTSTGHIEIKEEYDEDTQTTTKVSEDELDRQMLAKKFFELTK
jgi:replicative DNA helicase